MSHDRLQLLGRLIDEIYPQRSVVGLKNRVKCYAQAALTWHLTRQWFAADDSRFGLALKQFPLIRSALFGPYINLRWSKRRRLQVIAGHYRMTQSLPDLMFQPVLERLEIISLESEMPGLSLQLDKTNWFVREGELVLNLFLGEERLYSLAFTLGVESGALVAYVGAVQGRNLDWARDAYRKITRALHGMRPRDFLLTSLKMICAQLGVEQVWAISDDCRIHKSRFYGGSHDQKLHADYDQIWQDHQGVPMNNGFWAISTRISYRAPADIPVQKRKTYRLRYAMLDRCVTDIRTALEGSRADRRAGQAEPTPEVRTVH